MNVTYLIWSRLVELLVGSFLTLLTRFVFAWKDELGDERGCILIDDGQEANRKATYFVIRQGHPTTVFWEMI